MSALGPSPTLTDLPMSPVNCTSHNAFGHPDYIGWKALINYPASSYELSFPFLQVLCTCTSLTMQGTNIIKVINAQRARIIYHYKKTEEKILKSKSAKLLNKMCRLQLLTTKHIQVKVNGKNTRSINTIHNSRTVYLLVLSGLVNHLQ
jgi:hypothetical protein